MPTLISTSDSADDNGSPKISLNEKNCVDDDTDDNDIDVVVDDDQNQDQNHSDDEEEEDLRVVLHFDLDAFYVACERELNPALRDVPVGVSQYNPYGTLEEKSSHDIHKRWIVKGKQVQQQQHQHLVHNPYSKNKKTAPSAGAGTSGGSGGNENTNPDANGSLIAVSYEARAQGVKRNHRGKEACALCHQSPLNIVQVPVKHGKADLTMYRSASKRVFEALQQSMMEAAVVATTTTLSTSETSDNKSTRQSSSVIDASMLLYEIASIDEAYMDITGLVDSLVEQLLREEKEVSKQKSPSSTASSLWKSIVTVAGTCTTIGGVEVLSKAALATNALGKDELRRGSHVQVLDSSAHPTVDEGSYRWWNDRRISEFTNVQLRLACGAYLAAKTRLATTNAFEGGVFTLSAGISTNKTLAKLASGLKKPNRQTLIYRDSQVLQKLFHPLPLGRIRGLGGKFGNHIAEKFQIETVGQLAQLNLQELQKAMSTGIGDYAANNKTAQFLYDISRGLCRDPVTPRNKPKSIECSKTFRGHLSIPVVDLPKLRKWVGELCDELQERLQQDQDDHSRTATLMKVSVQFQIRDSNKRSSFVSKQSRAPRTLEKYPTAAMQMIQQLIESKKSSSSGCDDNDLLITGIAVGGMQFLSVAEGSSSIVAAIQKQKYLSQQEHGGSATVAGSSSPPAPPVTTKRAIDMFTQLKQQERPPSMMQQWLQESSSRHETAVKGKSNTKTSKIAREDCTGPSNKRTKMGTATNRAKTSCSSSSTMFDYVSLKDGAHAPSHPTNAAHSMMMVPMKDIDSDVFDALPLDVQRAVLSDIRYQENRAKEKKKREKAGGIQSFFQTCKPKTKN